MPDLPPPVVVRTTQLSYLPVAPDDIVQVQLRALQFPLQWQGRIQVRHGAINDSHVAQGVRGGEVGGGKRGYLQSQTFGRLEFEQCWCPGSDRYIETEDMHLRRDIPRAVAFRVP